MPKAPTPEEILRQLHLTIRFWEAKLLDRGLLNPSTAALVEFTVEYLKELDKRGYP